MHQLKSLVLLTFFLLFSSCSIKQKTIEEFNEKINKTYESEKLKNLDYIVLIPGAGCPGCVSSAESFAKKVYSSDRILLIFTSYQSRKILKLKLGIELPQPSIFLDEINFFNTGRTYSFYPTVFFMKDGSPVSFEYSDPNNPDLLKRISSDLNE